MPEPDPAAARPDSTDRLLRCGACRRTTACSPAQLLQYTRRGWPKCCGEVMTLFTPAARPDDTSRDVPSLPTDSPD